MRTEARVPTAIWRDKDFAALPSDARLLYLTVLTHPSVSPAGTLPLLPARWHGWTGLRVGAVEAAVGDLTSAHWLHTDEREQESYVAGFYEAEKVGRMPRRAVAAFDALRELTSVRLAGIASADLTALMEQAVPPAPRGLRLIVLERDGYRCRGCGWRPGDPVPRTGTGRELYRGLEIDHIHPRSQGGPDTVANFQVLCTSCNCRKGATV